MIHSEYSLCANVKVVLGENEAAIYCLDRHKIYRIPCALGEKILSRRLSSEELRQLVENNILVLGVEKQHSIQQAIKKQEDAPCFKKVWLEITPYCNLRCTHCYMGDVHTIQNPIDWAIVLNYLFTWGVEEIVLLGGEPFCSPELSDIIEVIRVTDHNVRIIIITNGTCCSLSTLQLIKKHNISLHFSLLGATASEHDAITQVPGSFEKLTQTIALATQLGIKVLLVSTLKHNESQKKSFIKQMVDERFPNIPVSFHLMRPQGRICSSAEEYIYDETQLATRISLPFYLESTHHHPCLYRKVVFSFNGEVYPSIMARYEHKKLTEVLLEKPTDIFDDWWMLTKDKIKGCCNCALRYACFDCRGYANSLTSPPINCKLAPKLLDK